nr:sodium:proton antiporter NhaD [uncultured Desulfobulbus sp.]
MLSAIIIVFILAYSAIALEHPLKINKSASALLAAGTLWTIYALAGTETPLILANLNQSLADIAQIVFFLTGAMTIVEVIDAHNGFNVITSKITTSKLSSLLWLVGFVTFFLSSILDNLTTTIVMISLMRKLLMHQEDRLFFAGIIVIAANAGGAWTPIGDVTTTMLWIGGQVTTSHIIANVLLPSLVCLLVPLTLTSYSLRSRVVTPPPLLLHADGQQASAFEQKFMFCMGVGILLAIPVFKSITHLPPCMGVLYGLGILWLAGELLHRKKEESAFKEHLSLVGALARIDMSAIVFFIGILLSVATLEHTHILDSLASWLATNLGREVLIVPLIGIASSIIDNVPLVAASMGMYPMSLHPPDSFLWEFMAYCAGTGGSMLIIGSAAGVAAMGLEKIHFFWYARKIGILAAIGYFSGIAVFMLQYTLLHTL